MKLKQLALLIMTSGTIVLTACNNQIGSSSASQNVQATNTNDKKFKNVSENDADLPQYTFLSGVLAKDGLVITNGSAFTPNDSESIVMSIPITNSKTSFTSNTSSLMSTLGISADITAQASSAGGSIAGSFLSDNAKSINSIEYYAFQSSTIQVKLSDSTHSVSGVTSKKFPYETMGDSFINALRMGMLAAMKITITSENGKALSALKASLKINPESGIDINAGFDSLTQEEQSSISVNVKAFQVGGDANELYGYLGYTDPKIDDVISSFNCQPQDLSKCNVVMQRFMNYLTLPARQLDNGFVAQANKYVKSGVGKFSDTYMLFPLENGKIQDMANGVYTVTKLNKKGEPVTERISYRDQNAARANVMESANLSYLNALYTIRKTLARQHVSYNTRPAIRNYNTQLSTLIDTLTNNVKSYCLNPLGTNAGGNDQCVTMLPKTIEDLNDKVAESSTTKIPGFVINGGSAFMYTADAPFTNPKSKSVSLMAIYTSDNNLTKTFVPGAVYNIMLPENSNNFTVNELTPDSFPFLYGQRLPNEVTASIELNEDLDGNLIPNDTDGNLINSIHLNGTWITSFDKQTKESTTVKSTTDASYVSSLLIE